MIIENGTNILPAPQILHMYMCEKNNFPLQNQWKSNKYNLGTAEKTLGKWDDYLIL